MSSLVRDTEIKLVNRDGRTVLSFVNRADCDDGVWTSDNWGVAVKPRSQKMLMHERPQPTQTPDRYLKQLPDGRRVLQLPGLTPRWENVTVVLDKLAETPCDDTHYRPATRLHRLLAVACSATSTLRIV